SSFSMDPGSSSPFSANSSRSNLQKTNPCSPFATYLSFACIVKLDRANYMVWRCNNLISYLTGSKPYPPVLITAADEAGEVTQVANPEFEMWNREDQLLLSWIFSTLSSTVLSQVIRCKTSQEV
ncbi:hypothetical protein PanWU01x14_350460, partial [Parasponia andersonii]